MTTSTIFFLEERGGKEIKMSSNYAFVASLSTSPPGNNFVGLVVVPKNQASSCLTAVAAVVLSSVVCQEKSKNQPTLWFFGETTTHFFCNIGIHILQQRYILHHTAYWFAILIIFAGKKVK